MADVALTRSALITASPDNPSGAITAQTFRNFITTAIPAAVFISGNYTATINDAWICALPSGSTSYTIIAPDAVGCSGRMLYIYKESDNTSTLTVAASGAQNIMGASSQTMVSKYSQLQIYSDGGGWETVKNSDYLGWKDVTSEITVRGGASSPSFTAIGTSGMYGYEFTGNQLKEIYSNFHILHDYAPGTDLYIHIHWLLGASGVGSQNVQWWFSAAYAKGYNQGAFNIQTPTLVNVIIPTSGLPIYEHVISEVQLSNNGGSGGLMNSANIQTDGIVMVHAWRNGGGASDTWNQSAYGLYMDIHYQTRKVSTLNRNYPFD